LDVNHQQSRFKVFSKKALAAEGFLKRAWQLKELKNVLCQLKKKFSMKNVKTNLVSRVVFLLF